MVSIYEAFDWMLPGQFEAFGHRKAFGERHVRDGISAGATQILVLGAGYDAPGWRLAPEFAEVTGWKHAPEQSEATVKHGVEFFAAAVK